VDVGAHLLSVAGVILEKSGDVEHDFAALVLRMYTVRSRRVG
jgi:hypothetical protein